MSNSNAMMGATSLFGAGLEAYQAKGQADAYSVRGRIAKDAADANASFLEMQAQDAIRRGDTAAGRSDIATRRLIGTQRAALAAQGIFADSGSGLNAQIEAGKIGAEDAATIRINAYREALGMKAKATNERFSGEISRITGDSESKNTLLSGGLRAAGRLAESGKYFSEYKKDITKVPPQDYSNDYTTSFAKKYPRNYGLSLGK